MSLLHLVRRLGGDLYAGGARANIPAPGHSRQDRSVSLWLVDGRVVINTFNGVDWRSVRVALAETGLVDAFGRLRDRAGAAGAEWSTPDPRPGQQARVALARRLWSQGRPIPGSLAERHLRRRAIASPPGPALRFHAGAPESLFREASEIRPALLAAVHSPDGAHSACEITYLARDGARASDLRLPRKTVGAVPPGSAVRLDPPASAMVVGEGVFTALSAAARFQRPAWALLSVRNLAAWIAPPIVRDVVIAADRGAPGLAAAQTLAERMARQGVRAIIAPPPAPWSDWNALAAAEAEAGGGGEGGVGAGR